MEARWTGFSDYAPELSNNPAIMETFVNILVCAVPIWVAVMIGLVIGWSWRPRWSGLIFLGFRSKLRFIWTAAPPGLGARRFWLAFTALSAFSVCRRLWFSSRDGSRDENLKVGNSSGQELVNLAPESPQGLSVTELNASDDSGIRTLTGAPDGELSSVTKKDLQHLLHLLSGKDGEMAWQKMMERSTSNMTYQAWRLEPEMGPIAYRSKTIFEDATPELVRDFFWDDEFRPTWDPMLVYVKILEECPDTGMMIVHWVKKFPFFCSDREYIIGRRIWESGKTYYCLTKGVPYPTLPRRDKPRRVDLYFSSWAIKPVQSRKGDGQLSACEVSLVHYEDMGIPKDVAKLGVRHGMWGAVKKLNAGFRLYQSARKSNTPFTRCALMAKITTKISLNKETGCGDQISGEEESSKVVKTQMQENRSGIDWKWLAIGGTVAVVCGLHTGLIGKAVLVGTGNILARRRGSLR